ncbi:MAG: hypothetical protein QM766_14880 [Burkholderiaceae bacterium]
MSSSTSISDPATPWRVIGLRAVGIGLGGLLLALVLQLALSQLPVVAGIHYADPRPGTPTARYAPGPYVNSLSWDLRLPVHGRVNDEGFLAPFEYETGKPVIGLFGDSFVEGLMVPFDQSLAGQLQARVAASPNAGLPATAYNFGFSAAALPHYLGLGRELSARYRLDSAVLVVIPGDYDEGFYTAEGQYSWADDDTPRPGEPLIRLTETRSRNALKKTLRQVALYRYLHGNLLLEVLPLFKHPSEGRGCEPARLSAADEQRIDRYVAELPEALKLPPERIVMVFNRNPYATLIYDPVDRPASVAPPCPSRDSLALDRLERVAGEHGVRIVDTTPMLLDEYRRHRRLLDFTPVDRHWNGQTIGLVASSIVDALTRSPADAPANGRPANERAANGRPTE